MKRSIITTFRTAAVALSLAGLAVSCEEPDGPDSGKVKDEYGNEFVTTETITPIRYTENEYKGGDNGVDIKVVSVTEDNIVFTCGPGTDVNSYMVNVYPMAAIYNTLLNQLNFEGKQAYDYQEVHDLFSNIVTNVEDPVSGGVLFNERKDGEDFYSLELDYMNSELQVFNIQPDMDYLIVAQAFFSDNSAYQTDGLKDPADICICHVKTEAKEIVGNPVITFNTDIGYTQYRVTHVPNADCKYFYYLSTGAGEIDQYIDAYGDDMYAQFLCNYGAKVNVENGILVVNANDQPQGEYAATAVACDVNGTPYLHYYRKDFTLKSIPEGSQKPECEIYMDDECRVGGSIVEFKCHLENNCRNLRFLVYTKEEADDIMEDEELKETLGQAFLTNNSWVVENKNFRYDRENDALTGEDYEEQEFWWELAGDTEYRIVYIGYDYFLRASEVKATEAFRTKPLERNNPKASIEDLEMDIIATDRTSVTMQFKYDPENTALYYFQYYDPCYAALEGGVEGRDYPVFPKEGDDEVTARNKWLAAFLDFKNPDPYQTPWPNMWDTQGTPRGVTHEEEYRWSGFDPETTFKFAYLAEDWNGVYGDVKLCQGTTPAVVGGDNPTLELSYEKQVDGTYSVRFQANDETREIRYMVAILNESWSKELALDALYEKNPDITYDDYVSDWSELVLRPDGGLSSKNTWATSDVPGDAKLAVAIGISVGGKDAGSPKYSGLKALVFKDGQVQTLEDYLGVQKTKTATVTFPRTSGPSAVVVRPGGRARVIPAR